MKSYLILALRGLSHRWCPECYQSVGGGGENTIATSARRVCEEDVLDRIDDRCLELNFDVNTRGNIGDLDGYFVIPLSGFRTGVQQPV